MKRHDISNTTLKWNIIVLKCYFFEKLLKKLEYSYNQVPRNKREVDLSNQRDG